MNWRVFIDFDGTIALRDTTDLILEKFADPQWSDIEALWQRGLIGSRECMRRQVSLIRASEQEFLEFLDTIAVDPGFGAFVEQCNDLNVPVKIVSDGLDLVVKHVLQRAGFGSLPVAANALCYEGAGRWSLTSPFGERDCRVASGTCKCAVASGLRSELSLLIGDGRSDQCLADSADFVFAKASLVRHCQDQGLAHVSFESFIDLAEPLARLVQIPHHQFALLCDRLPPLRSALAV